MRKTWIGRVGFAVSISFAVVCCDVANERTERSQTAAAPVAPKPVNAAPMVPSGPRPSAPLTIDEEAVGFVAREGYDYPDHDVGTVVCPKPKGSVRVYAIAWAAERARWVLAASTACAKPSWFIDASWPQDTHPDLPTVSSLPSVRWPNSAELPAAALAVGAAAPSIGDNIEAHAEPGLGGSPICLIPKGSEVRALAQVANEQSLDVLVRASACSTPAWIWTIDVKWQGLEFWDLRKKLPKVHAALSGPLRPLELVVATPTVATAAPRASAGAPVHIFVGDTKGREHPWHRALPEAWRASRLEDATLVATVKQTPEMVQTCTFIPQGAVYRVRPGYAVTLSLADRSRVVAHTTLQGETPAACPDSVTVEIGGGQKTDAWKIGAEPGVKRLVAWLRPFALGR